MAPASAPASAPVPGKIGWLRGGSGSDSTPLIMIYPADAGSGQGIYFYLFSFDDGLLLPILRWTPSK